MKFIQYENKGLSGLVNLGNTCFMNSGLQCLSNTYLLTQYILDKKYLLESDKNNDKFNLLNNYYELLKGLWGENCIISPNSFLNSFKKSTNNKEFQGFKQNDVQEFLIFFIDSLHTSLCREVNINISGNIENDKDKKAYEAMKIWKLNFEKSYSKIIDLFYGQIIQTVTFVDTQEQSFNYDPCCFFTLPIPNNIKNINIYDCFNLYTEDEVLDDNEKILCEKTNTYKKAIKNIKLWSTPKILIIIFKRFNNFNQKIINFINFPLDNLDLSKYCVGYNNNNVKYNLYAICNHSGNHYYSFCKNANNKWYEYNDSTVSEINKSKIITDKAYCLFYLKKNI